MNNYVTTMKIHLESGIVIMAAGNVIDGEVEFYELAGVVSEDNFMEICEKFIEAFNDQRESMN